MGVESDKRMIVSRNPRRAAVAWLAALVPGVSALGSVVTAEAQTPGMHEPEEVIVTAQRRQERLIDVPQSMSVLSTDYLDKINAVQFRDFANTVPGLNFTTSGAGQNRISLRGVTAGNDVSPTVGIYVDDVPYGSSTTYLGSVLGLDMALFDLERIEVLRGPQGTLYGASSLGGLIKYVTSQPDTKNFSGDVQAGLSGTQHGGTNYSAAMAVNAPIVEESVAVRLSGFYSRDGGYVDNVSLGQEDVNNSDIYGGRADLLLTPTEKLKIRIVGFAQEIERDGSATSSYTLAGMPIDDSLSQRRVRPESFTQSFYLGSGTVTYDFGWSELTSISSYQSARSNLVADLSPLYVPLLRLPIYNRSYSAVTNDNDLNWDKVSQEVRLVSGGSNTLDWLIGAFYTHETSDNDSVLRPYDLSGQPAATNIFNTFRPSRYEEYAAFGDLTWHLTDKFDVTGGIRHSRMDVETRRIGSGLLIGSQAPTASEDEISTYLANARYRFTDHMTAYVRYATGYRPGGPNFAVVNPATGQLNGPEEFKADSLDSYEMGFKAETESGVFGIDAAGYYVEWDDIQVSISRGVFSGIYNAPGGATVRGAELTLNARPVSGLGVAASFAYQDAELAKADADLRGAKGERLPNVPDIQATLSADYEFPIAGWYPTFGATLRHVSERTSGFRGAPTSYYRLPEYTAVDLRTGITFGSMSLQLYVRNLTDERGQLSTTVLSNVSSVALLQPRTIGMRLATSF